MMNKQRTVSFLIGILLFCGLLRGFFLIASTPPWQAADEVTHFEAMYMYAASFPDVYSIKTDVDVQRQIIESMTAFDFFKYVKVPQPEPLPDCFADTPFLEAAPTKIGRQPLYYWIVGFLSRWTSSSLLGQLFAARTINLFFAISAVFVLITAIRTMFPFRKSIPLLAGSFVIWHPGLWHLCSSVTQESWNLLLSSLFFLCFIRSYLKSSNSTISRIFWITLLLTILTRWTLFISLAYWIVLILLIIPLPFDFLNKFASLKNRLLMLIAILLTTAFYMLFLAFSGSDTLKHELQMAVTGLSAFIHHPIQPLLHHGGTLFHTFWGSFGWLTLSIPGFSSVLFIFITIFIVFSGVTAIVYAKKEQRWIFTASIGMIGYLIFITLIRASSSEPAIQGRYLFPSIPAIALCFTGLSSILSQKRRNFFLGGVLPILGLMIADWGAICGGHFFAFHISHYRESPMKQALRYLKWSGDDSVGIYINFTSSFAREYMFGGWYPNENASHVWFRKTAGVSIPMMPQREFFIKIRALPYQPQEQVSCKLRILFNKSFVGEKTLDRGWNEFVLRVPSDLIESPFNTVLFVCDQERSPKSLGESDDPRILSIALEWIQFQDNLASEDERFEKSCTNLSIEKPYPYILLLNGMGIISTSPIDTSITFQTDSGNFYRMNVNTPAYYPQGSEKLHSFGLKSPITHTLKLLPDILKHCKAGLPGIWGYGWFQISIMTGYFISYILGLITIFNRKSM
ncbi:DUF2142 domain-containing protein [bacterium]|nr:DUF2142 domain-containing protein [candidate division CSSED10-310 bacterium]